MYFRSIFRINSLHGSNVFEKLQHLLHANGIDEEQTRILETPKPVDDYSKERYIRARERRDRSLRERSGESPESDSRSSSGKSYVSSTKSHEYEGEDEGSRKGKRRIGERRSRHLQEMGKRKKAQKQKLELPQANRAPRYLSHAVQTSTPEVSASVSVTEDDSLDEATEQLQQYHVDDESSEIDPESEYGKAMANAQRRWEAYQSRLDRRLQEGALNSMRERLTENDENYDRAMDYYETRLLGACFEEWRRVVHNRIHKKRIYFFNLNNYLNKQDWKLQRGILEFWARKTRAIQNRTQETANRILARKYFRRWQARYAETRAMEERARMFLLKKTMANLTRGMHKMDGPNVIAQNFRKTSLLKMAMNHWYNNFNIRVAGQSYDKKLKQRAWLKLQAKFFEIKDADDYANMFVLQTIAGGAWDQWVKRTDELRLAQDDAEENYEWKLLERVVGHWRDAARYAPATKDVLFIREHRTINNFLTLWKNRVRNLRLANTCYDTRLMRNFLKKWRYKYAESKTEGKFNDRIVTHYIYTWVLHSRYRLLKGVKEGKLKQKVLRAWKERTEEKESVTGNNMVLFTIASDSRLANKVMDTWIDRMFRLRAMNDQAEQHFRMKALSRAFAFWKSRSDHIETLKRKSEALETFFAYKMATKRWKLAHKAHKRQKLRDEFSDFTKGRKKRLASKVLEHWRTQTEIRQELNARAAAFLHDRTLRVAKAVVRDWHEQTHSLIQADQDAVLYSQSKLVERAFFHLTSRHEHLQRLEFQAEAHFRQRHVEKTAREILKKWAHRNNRLRIDSNAALTIANKQPQKQLRRILNKWRNKALRFQQARQEQQQNAALFGNGQVPDIFPEPANIWSNQPTIPVRNVFETPRPAWLNSPKKTERRWAGTIRTARTERTAAWTSTTPLGVPGPSRLAPLTAGWGATPMGSPLRRPVASQVDTLMEEDEHMDDRTEHGIEYGANDMPSDSGLGSVGGLGSSVGKGFGG